MKSTTIEFGLPWVSANREFKYGMETINNVKRLSPICGNFMCW